MEWGCSGEGVYWGGSVLHRERVILELLCYISQLVHLFLSIVAYVKLNKVMLRAHQFKIESRPRSGSHLKFKNIGVCMDHIQQCFLPLVTTMKSR